MKKLISAVLEAFTKMAVADMDYWAARQYLADPELADLIALSLMPGLHPTQRVTLYCGSSMPAAHAESDAALAEVEAILAAARHPDTTRRDLVRSS